MFCDTNETYNQLITLSSSNGLKRNQSSHGISTSTIVSSNAFNNYGVESMQHQSSLTMAETPANSITAWNPAYFPDLSSAIIPNNFVAMQEAHYGHTLASSDFRTIPVENAVTHTVIEMTEDQHKQQSTSSPQFTNNLSWSNFSTIEQLNRKYQTETVALKDNFGIITNSVGGSISTVAPIQTFVSQSHSQFQHHAFPQQFPAFAHLLAAVAAHTHTNHNISSTSQLDNNLSVIDPSYSKANSLQSTLTTHASHQMTNQYQPQHLQELRAENILKYVACVRKMFEDQPLVLFDFYTILNEFHTNSINVLEAMRQILILFTGHPELIMAFDVFLPPGYKIEVNSNVINVLMTNPAYAVPSSQNIIPFKQINYTDHSQTRVAATVDISLNVVHDYLAYNSFSTRLPLKPAQNEKESDKLSTKALCFVQKLKDKFQVQPEVYLEFLTIISEFKAGSLNEIEVFQKVLNLFDSNIALIMEFTTFFSLKQEIRNNMNKIRMTETENSSLPLQQSAFSRPPVSRITPSISSYPCALHEISGNQTNNLFSTNLAPVEHETPILPITHESNFNLFNQALKSNRGQNLNKSSYAFDLNKSADKAALNKFCLNNSSISSAPPPIYTNNQTNMSVYTNSNMSSHVQASSNHSDAQPDPNRSSPVFMKKVEQRFNSKRDVVNKFIVIWQNTLKEQHHKARMLTESRKQEIYDKVAELFGNEDDLLKEFGRLLKLKNSDNSLAMQSIVDMSGSMSSYVQPSSSNNHTYMESVPIITKDAIIYCQKVKNCFVNQPEIYTQIFGILKKYQEEQNNKDFYGYKAPDKNEVFHKVAELLKNHEDLLNEFIPFLIENPAENASHSDIRYSDSSPANLNNLVTSRPTKRNRRNSFNDGSIENCLKSQRMLENESNSLQNINNSLYGLDENNSNCDHRIQSFSSDQSLQQTLEGFSTQTNPDPEVSSDNEKSNPYTSKYYVSVYETFYAIRKNQEDDERCVIDVEFENTQSTLRVLEAVQKKIERMSPQERASFKLDDHLGGSSKVLHKKTIKNLYNRFAIYFIENLKNNPVRAVPTVIARLRDKIKDLTSAYALFNSAWREVYKIE